MQPDNPGLPYTAKLRQRDLMHLNRFSIPAVPLTWLIRLTRRWSIRQKVAYGYCLAIGIAVCGTSMGLIVGDYYQNQEIEKLRLAQQKHALASRLQYVASQAQSHQQRLIPVLGNRVWQDYEISHFYKNIITAQALLSELESRLQPKGDIYVSNPKETQELLRHYEITITAYSQLVKSLWQQVNADNLAPEQIQAAQQTFLLNLTGEVAIKFDRLSEGLEKLVEAALLEEQQSMSALNAAIILRMEIIIASMLLSIAFAAILIFYTSRAIASPIKAVTNVAQQATQEGNFNLQAPVTTEDEVGVLATSLNQLIQRVAKQMHEINQAQAQLIQSEKMSGLGLMVAGIAHEINNPVNFIYANVDHVNNYTKSLLELVHLYQQHYPQPVLEIQTKIEEIELDFLSGDFLKIISSMQMGTERIQQIICSLRNFSRLDESEMKQVNIHEGIDSTLLILNYRLKQKIEIIKEYGNLPLIECYPAQLNQVFMNILSNGIDALLENVKASKPQIRIQTNRIGFDKVEIRIYDNGAGIPSKIKNKIFDPFFTTKPVGKGTGMGLAICYKILEKHRGKIEVISEVGQGTEFVVTLPIL
jgi:signal transduction histidine kinase